MWQSEAGMSCSNREESTGRRSAFAGSGPAAETRLQSPENRAGHCQPHFRLRYDRYDELCSFFLLARANGSSSDVASRK